MSYQEAITDSDVIDGLSVRYLKIFGLWKVINDYRTTGKKNAIVKIMIIMTFILSLPYILEHKRVEAIRINRKVTFKCNVFCMAAFLVNTSIIVLSITFPGISVDYIAGQTGSTPEMAGGKMKILGGWYPVPMAESPYYEIIFVYETILTLQGGILVTVNTCLFYQILMCLYAQFAVLSYYVSTLELRPVITDKRKRNISERDWFSEMYNELRAIIQNHQKLLSNANELRRLYNPLVTIILGVGIFVLIIAVFQFLFGQRENPMFIFRSIQFLAYQAIEVCMFCFGSSYIDEASTDLQFAIYSSDWYKADIKFRKTAQMLMLRARKGETLTAIRMYPVNVETIMAIFQFTYSVATFLSRMMEK